MEKPDINQALRINHGRKLDELRPCCTDRFDVYIKLSLIEAMTSAEGKQRRLSEAQLARAKALAGIDATDPDVSPPLGAVLADPAQLSHNNTYGRLPRFYVDRLVVCRNCGTEEVWPAERQKWWYEEAKGNINTQAVLCRSCRAAERKRKDAARAAAGHGSHTK